ncbi:MAG: leucine-rich repeat domain-containing protein [Oscillospiraceae bacterium]|nr:leucine-rich repeat domain-containing protein [Oscillospiraceae bacterium]
MKKSKVTALILAMVMAISLFTIPASAENLTAADALAILKHVAGTAELTTEQRAKYGYEENQEVTAAHALAVLRAVVGFNAVEIDLSEQGITDSKLAEMVRNGEIPQNVTSLNLNSNFISDLTPLKGLTSLTELGLYDNPFTDISPLSGLTNLEYLDLRNVAVGVFKSDEDLENGDIFIQRADGKWGVNPNNIIYFDEGLIKDITPLKGLVKLEYLLLQNNFISDISPLSGLVNLKALGLWSNNISDLTPIGGLKNLTSLSVSDNKITDFTVIKGLTNLENLYITLGKVDPIGRYYDYGDIAYSIQKEIQAALPNCEVW